LLEVILAGFAQIYYDLTLTVISRNKRFDDAEF